MELAQIFRFKSFRPGENFDAHSHRRIEINYVRKGACVMNFGNESVPLAQNQMVVIFPDTVHSFMPGPSGVAIMQLEFMPDVFSSIARSTGKEEPSFLREILSGRRKYIKIINDIRITRAIQRIVDELTDCNEFHQELVYMHYAEVLLLISRHITHSEGPLQKEPLAKAVGILNASFTSDISIRDVAAECGVSERYLRKLFSAYMNVPPLGYLNSLRVGKAKELLHNTGQSIKEVAFLCGFNSTEYFVRMFKKEVGTTPKIYQQEPQSASKNATG